MDIAQDLKGREIERVARRAGRDHARQERRALAGTEPEHRLLPLDARLAAPSLRSVLVVSDIAAVVVVVSAIAAPAQQVSANEALAVAAAVACLAVGLAWLARLYRSRVCAIRTVEAARLAPVALVCGAATAPVLGAGTAAAGAIALYLALLTGRSIFREWVRARRMTGRFSRDVIVAGRDDEAEILLELVADHPELGFRACGFAGGTSDLEARFGVPRLGPLERVAATASAVGASGVILSLAGLGTREAQGLLAQLADARLHVNVTTALSGIDHRRLRAVPIAHEPFFYVEDRPLRRRQRMAKRALDIVGSVALLVLAAPVLAAAALAIKLQDGGPVLFRQVRVGLNEGRFLVLKLRTMSVGAELKLDEVAARNQRTGPLFKAADDPRVTAVGRLLRDTSIDELPQLWNVLRGEMSLVGPRPALPEEVATFDSELRGRHRVPPGITGLWQIEGRNKPSFTVYRHLDLFYVENWSLGMDLAILARTALVTLGRAALVLRRGIAPRGQWHSSTPAGSLTDHGRAGRVADGKEPWPALSVRNDA